MISGGANGVHLEAEKLATHYGLKVKVLIPPCHPRKASVQPLTHQQLAEAIPTTRQVAARLNKNLENPISLQYIHRNLKVAYALEEQGGLWKWLKSSRKSCMCTMCSETLGFGITPSKICFTRASKCLKNSTLYPL